MPLRICEPPGLLTLPCYVYSVGGFSLEFALLNPSGFFFYSVYSVGGRVNPNLGTGSVSQTRHSLSATAEPRSCVAVALNPLSSVLPTFAGRAVLCGAPLEAAGFF